MKYTLSYVGPDLWCNAVEIGRHVLKSLFEIHSSHAMPFGDSYVSQYWLR